MDIIPKDIMNELYIRFSQDLDNFTNNFTNIFSIIETMYWFYIDQFFAKETMANVDLIDFVTQFFDQFQHIIPKDYIWEHEFDIWKAMKSKTPTSSAIIMDSKLEMILMVKGFGSKRWTFPGGKKEKETFKQCAIREVDEEIGYDISDKIDDDLLITLFKNGIKRYHYIIYDIPLNTCFKPKTNFEIEKITWFPLNHLPESRMDECYSKLNAYAKDFLPALDVLKIMKKWVKLVTKHDKKEALRKAIEQFEFEESRSNKPRSKSFSDVKEINKISQEPIMQMKKQQPNENKMSSKEPIMQIKKQQPNENKEPIMQIKKQQPNENKEPIMQIKKQQPNENKEPIMQIKKQQPNENKSASHSTTRNKMYTLTTGKHKTLDTVLVGILFNKEEFLSHLHRELQRH